MLVAQATRCNHGTDPLMYTTDIVSILLLIALTPLLIVDAFFATEVAAGLARGRKKPTAVLHGDVVIVIPAHDEEAVIGATLASLGEALGERMRVLVVADNCGDQTAEAARADGATVIERHDASKRGKGFALAFARDWLGAQPPESVVVLDADCRIDRASLANLASLSQANGRAVQAVNLLSAGPQASPMVQISTFAFLIKNLVRQRGLQRLAGRVHLTGTGMCLPWRNFAEADLATASIVEDLRLGLELAERGVPPMLAEDAFVRSPHAAADQTLGQRSRWEGGFLATMRATAPGLLSSGVRARSFGTIAAGLDLLVPPLALFAMVNLAALGVAILCGAMGLASWAPALALMLVGAAAAFVLMLAWWREGRQVLGFGALVRIPLYALWKLPMYAGLVRKGAPRSWNRTARVQETNHEAP